MKKLVIILILSSFGIFYSLAQPNGGFENWTPEATYENPDGWATVNFLSLTNPPNPLSVFKAIGIDKHSGNYAMKIQTIALNNNPNPSILGDTTGGVFTGKINISPFSFVYGFPYTGRPEKLEFWAKYQPVNNDTAETFVVLLKRNGAIRDTVGFGRIVIPPTPLYNLFQMDITYYSNDLPDTASMAFGASKYKSGISSVGSTLFLDDLAFTGWVGIDEKNKCSDKVLLSPNPAKDNLTITAEFEEASNIKISDVAGKIVGWFKIQNYKTTINTSSFVAGIYLYEIFDKNEKMLANGKFSIVK